MAPRPLAHLSLCSGYGGMDLALTLAGLDHRTVAHVERDSHAAATLVARMEEQALDPAPVWDDVTTFDGGWWRGRVDIITAGFPCQPWSAAGLRGGVDDDRWLWPAIRRIIRDVGPGLVFLENVPQLNPARGAGGLPHVLQDLADLGFDAEWGLLGASDIGATHRRERFWLLAYTDRDRLQAVRASGRDGGHEAHDADGPGGAVVADAEAAGVGGDEGLGSDPDEQASWWVDAPAGGRAWPPGPDDVDGWAEWTARGGPEPQVRREVDGATGRLVKPVGIADRLHLLGNGLVPQVAAVALTRLAERALT